MGCLGISGIVLDISIIYRINNQYWKIITEDYQGVKDIRSIKNYNLLNVLSSNLNLTDPPNPLIHPITIKKQDTFQNPMILLKNKTYKPTCYVLVNSKKEDDIIVVTYKGPVRNVNPGWGQRVHFKIPFLTQRVPLKPCSKVLPATTLPEVLDNSLKV